MDYKQKNRDHKRLKLLYAKSAQYKDIKQMVKQYLPQPLMALLVESTYHSGILTLEFSNQLALSQCRFILPKLQQQLKTDHFFHSIKKIRPIIASFNHNKQYDAQNKISQIAQKNQAEVNTKPPKNKHLLYSDYSAKLLHDLSKDIESPSLSHSLERLSKSIAKS